MLNYVTGHTSSYSTEQKNKKKRTKEQKKPVRVTNPLSERRDIRDPPHLLDSKEPYSYCPDLAAP